MPRFAANLTMMFTEHAFLDRFAAAAAAGFDAVEFLFPYDHPPGLIAEALERHGLTQALFNLGLIYYSTKQLDAAEALWRRAVLIDPSFTDACNNLAISLAQQGKYPEAETVLKKMISSNPNYIDGYFNIANFYARTGKEKEALFYVGELKKRGITRDQFVKRGIKLSPELEKVFE